MSEINYKAITERIMECSFDKLSEWEQEFFTSIVEREYDLTEKQKDKIRQINRKILSGR